MILLQMRALLFQFQRHCRSSVRYEYRGCHVLACKKTSNGKIPFYPSKTPTISLASSSRRPHWANAIDRPSLAKLLPPVDSPLCPLPTSMSLTAGHLSVCRESGTQMAVLFTAADHGPPSFSLPSLPPLCSSSHDGLITGGADHTRRWNCSRRPSNCFSPVSFRGQVWLTSDPISDAVIVTAVVILIDWDHHWI